MGLSDAHKTWLRKHFGENAAFDEPMHRHTSFRIGGPADAMVKPVDTAQMAAIGDFCRRNRLPLHVVGRGSNLLVKDNGIRGVVVVLEAGFTKIDARPVDDETVLITVQAGAGLPRLCRHAADNGYAGLNFAVGIPGSVGGAVMMNAGTVDGTMADVIEKLTLFSFASGTTRTLAKTDMVFGYRKLVLRDRSVKDFVVLEIEIRLKRSDPEVVAADAAERRRHRKATQPVSMASCGCIFKNPAEDAAGRLIDGAGLKGIAEGDAQISDRHANYIVNRGRATAVDVMTLMDLARTRVMEKYGIALEPEVVIVGE